MGELKTLRAQQEQLSHRLRELGQTLHTLSRGVARQAPRWLDQVAARGAELAGADASERSRYRLAGQGARAALTDLVRQAPEQGQALYQRLLEAGRTQRAERADRTPAPLLALTGAVTVARDETRQLLDQLLESGRDAHPTDLP